MNKSVTMEDPTQIVHDVEEAPTVDESGRVGYGDEVTVDPEMNKCVTIMEDPTQVVHVEEAPAVVDHTRRVGYGSSCTLDPDDEATLMTRGSDEEILSHRYSVSKSTNGSNDLHMLASYRPGDSKVERMCKKIETRINERVEVTFNSRRGFLKKCRRIAIAKGYPKATRVLYSDILQYRDEIKEETENNDAEGIFSRVITWCGVLHDKQCLARILDKAKTVADKIDLQPEDEFHYQDFNHHHTVLVSRWPWMRYELLFAISLVLMFYFITPILFCVIMHDEGICPQDSKVPGWVSALYFASATMSTVGYGDLSVEKDASWKVAIGTFYMIASILIALLAFSAAAETTVSPVTTIIKRFSPLNYPEGPLKENEYLYQRIRKVKAIMLCDIVLQFTFLNLIGIFASQLFIAYTEVAKDRMWNWVDSMYWAVQTTTTIGYGDYSMPEYMRPFQIFYLSLGTYFTGNALGKLSTLKEEIDRIRRHHAFERREVNKHMMHYLASTDDPSRVDQYEFVIASLLNLGKITASDIDPIMDKFRTLARNSGNYGYIRVADIPEETDVNFDELTEMEGVEGA